MQPDEINEIINAVKNSADDAAKCDAVKNNVENKLSEAQKKKLTELLSDSDKLNAFLNSSAAKAIMQKFGNRNGE